MSKSPKQKKAKAADARPAAKDIRGAIEFAHELYMYVEHAVAEALHNNSNIRAEIRIPYHVVMQLPKGTYDGAELIAKINIKWDGSLHGVESDIQSGKIS